MIENKYVYLGCNLYKLTRANKRGINNSVSLVNIMTGEFARHQNGVICDCTYQEDELFLYDSTFTISKGENNTSFYCTNPKLETHCITNYFDGVIRIIEYKNIQQHENRYVFNLLNENEIYAKDNLNIINGEKKIIVFGSSSSEVFDYIFGDNKDYLPFWASGWSARGLRNINKHIKPYLNILNKLSKDSIILLHFGNVDVDFNLNYKMNKDGFYDIPLFIKEMVDGIITLKLFLNNLGFTKIYSIFTAAPINLPREYWSNFFDLDYISPILRGKVLWDFLSVCRL